MYKTEHSLRKLTEQLSLIVGEHPKKRLESLSKWA
jgi:hypothetical protein